MRLAGREVVILGAGGAARGIAYEALQRGAHISLLNRTESRAKRVASELGIEGGGLALAEKIPYDLLINTTAVPFPLPLNAIRKKALFFDISHYPREDPFLKEALRMGGSLILGKEMWINQAVAQWAIWFPSLDTERVLRVLRVCSTSRA